MSDDLTNRGAQDRALINMSEGDAVQYLTEALGVNPDTLQRAVDEVGSSAEAVREYLAGHPGD